MPFSSPVSRPTEIARSRVVLEIQQRLERLSFPRVQMALIVALTGAAGLLASFVMLHRGVDSMALRYPLAVGFAYLVFFGLLWLWLRTNSRDYDPGNLDFSGSPSGPDAGDCAPALQNGGGGDFGGGGAEGSFENPSFASSSEVDAGASIGDAVGSVDDIESIPYVFVLFVAGLALAAFSVVYLAPVLFAELLVDGVLSYVLYRRMRIVDRRHWLESAIRRTALPFALTAVGACIAGAAMSWYSPGARSIGEVTHQAAATR